LISINAKGTKIFAKIDVFLIGFPGSPLFFPVGGCPGIEKNGSYDES